MLCVVDFVVSKETCDFERGGDKCCIKFESRGVLGFCHFRKTCDFERGQMLNKLESREVLEFCHLRKSCDFEGGTNAEKNCLRICWTLLRHREGPMLKERSTKNFLDSVISGDQYCKNGVTRISWGRGTNTEKIESQELLGLCHLKKVKILRGGPVKRSTP